MTGYIVHNDQYGSIRDELVKVIAMAIASYLDDLPSDVDRVSSIKVKKVMGYTGSTTTFARAAQLVTEYTVWMAKGRVFTRLFSPTEQ
jgi:hypothetical protein